MKKIDVKKLASQIEEPWTPTFLCDIDQYRCYIGVWKGEDTPHKHDKDQFFLALDGDVEIELKDQETVSLREHECISIDSGVVHKPKSRKRSIVLFINAKDITRIEVAS